MSDNSVPPPPPSNDENKHENSSSIGSNGLNVRFMIQKSKKYLTWKKAEQDHLLTMQSENYDGDGSKQTFFVQRVSGQSNIYTIHPIGHLYLYVEIFNGDMNNGSKIRLNVANSTQFQQWKIENIEKGVDLMVINMGSNKAMDDSGSKKDDVQPHQWDADPTNPNQIWCTKTIAQEKFQIETLLNANKSNHFNVNPHPDFYDFTICDRFFHQLYNLKAKMPPKNNLNFLLIGPTGSGVSSLGNTMLTCLQDGVSDTISEHFLVHNTYPNLCTKALKIKQVDNFPIRVYETWGYHRSEIDHNYGDGFSKIKSVVNGRFMNGFKINSEELGNNLTVQRSPPMSDRIHCVIIAIEASWIKSVPTSVTKYNHTDVVWTNTNKLISTLHALDYRPIIVITKIDEKDEALLNNPHIAYDVKIIQELISAVSIITQLPLNRIFPCKSYHNEIYRRYQTENIPLYILKKAVDLGLLYYTSIGGQFDNQPQVEGQPVFISH